MINVGSRLPPPCRSPLVVHSSQCNTVRHRIHMYIHSPYLTLCGACGKSLIRVRRRARRGVCLRGAGGGGEWPDMHTYRGAGIYPPPPICSARGTDTPILRIPVQRRQRGESERRTTKRERQTTRDTNRSTHILHTPRTQPDGIPLSDVGHSRGTPLRDWSSEGVPQRVVPEPQTHPTPSETRPGGTPLEAG